MKNLSFNSLLSLALLLSSISGVTAAGDSLDLAKKKRESSKATPQPGKNNSLFPKEVQILLPTHYRKESTGYPKGVKDKKWYEIYKNKKTGKWTVARARLVVSYGRDECVGEDTMIIKSKNENAVLFFTPFSGLTDTPKTVLEDRSLFPGHVVTFELNGKKYKLSPMGSFLNSEGHILPLDATKVMSEEELGDSRIKSYMLSFVTPDNISYQIAEVDQMLAVTPKVIWAGDLNNDGLPDMILDLRDFYESEHIFLFLSDPSDKKRPLKKVADLQVANDC